MIAPGIYDALSAKAAQAAGLPCLAMGGYAISASRLGQPDVGLLSLTEMATALKWPPPSNRSAMRRIFR